MTTRRGWRDVRPAAAVGTLCWAIGSAAPAAAAPATTSDPSTVAEVIVTATRQAQSLSKVPESVSAFTAARMEIKGIKTFAQVARFTPGVTYDEARHDVSIRGVESRAGSGTTGIYIDDTPIQVRALGLNANNSLPAVFDLARVEVVRGPQGTLFGAGSEGGTVRYITTQPSLTTYSGMAHSELAFTQDGAPTYEGGVAAGGPIIKDVLGFRASVWARHDGGYIDRVDYHNLDVTQANANWVDTYVLRGALTWSPTAALTITPGINYQKRDQNNYDDYWVAISDPGAGVLRNGTPDKMPDSDRFYAPTLRMEYDTKALRFISNSAYYNRKEHVGGYSGTLYNLSYYQQITGAGNDPLGNPCMGTCQSPLLTPTGPNVVGLPNYIARNVITNTQSNYTQEFRVQNADSSARLIWVVGLFYTHNAQQSTEVIQDPMFPQITQLLWGEDVVTAWGSDLLPGNLGYINDTIGHDQQLAGFAEGSYFVTPQLKLTAGLRYAWTKFDFTNLSDGPQNGGQKLASGEKTEHPLTPKVVISYQLTSDDMLYGSVAKGYRIGGATPPLPVNFCGGVFPTQYDSDSLWSYEVGTKNRFFDRRLQVSASAFYIRWNNIQQAIYVPTCGIQYTANTGNAVSKGFDAETSFQVTKAFVLDATVGYTDAKFVTDAKIDNTLPATTDNLLARAGDSLDVVPWQITLGAQYNFTLSGLPAFVRADDVIDTYRTTPIPSEDPGTHYYDASLIPNPATNELNLRAGVTIKSWDLQIYLNNVINSTPQLSLNHQDKYTTLFEASTFRPRTIGLSANYKY